MTAQHAALLLKCLEHFILCTILFFLTGGQLCQSVDSECTHIVVDNKDTLPHDVRSSIAIVKAEWFWASVQMEVCADERLYTVEVVSLLS